MKRWSIPVITREMKTNATMRYHNTPPRNQRESKRWRGHGETGALRGVGGTVTSTAAMKNNTVLL